MTLDAPQISPIDNRTWINLADYPAAVFGLHILILAGFIFDGASIPRLFWRLVGHPMQGLALPAALVHDALYRAHLTTRQEADKIFYALLRRNGIGKIKAWIMYRAVRAAGARSWKQYSGPEQTMARNYVIITEQ